MSTRPIRAWIGQSLQIFGWQQRRRNWKLSPNGQYSYRLPADMTRDRSAWETAAIVFDNLDIASYYTDYYIPCGEQWRELIS